MYICVCVCMGVCEFTCVRVYLYIYLCTPIHTYTSDTDIYIHTCKYIYVFTCFFYAGAPNFARARAFLLWCTGIAMLTRQNVTGAIGLRDK